MAEQGQTRAAIYARISEDRDGSQQATARQKADCTAFCERQGWRVVGMYEDIDVSAYKRGIRRPQFEAMLETIAAGEVDAVVSWKLDRLCRRQKDIIRVLEATEQRGAFVVTLADSIDTRTVSGRAVAEIMTTMATMESESTSIRVARAHLQAARQGKPSRGGHRLFGLTDKRDAIMPEEATLVHEAVGRLLAGESLWSVAADFGRRGVKSPAGNPWRPAALRTSLLSPALAGLRMVEGKAVVGQWPAVLNMDEHTRLRLLLTAPGRRGGGMTARSYLLGGGLVRCGRCGSTMISRPRKGGTRRYVCASGPARTGCGRMARLAEPIETMVTEAVFAALEDADLGPYLKGHLNGEERDLVQSITADEATLEQLSRDHYVDKVIGRQEFFSARAAVRDRLDSNRMKLLAHRNAAVLGAITAGAEVRRQWPARPLEWKRAIISALVDHVRVMPAARGPFDPTKIEIVWRA